MAGCFGNNPEDRARERDLNAYLDKTYAKDEAIQNAIEHMTEEYLNDETLFRTLDDDYEIIDRGQVMRALRSLDEAIRTYEFILSGGSRSSSIDAVFTALSNIQAKFNSAIEHEATEDYEGRME